MIVGVLYFCLAVFSLHTLPVFAVQIGAIFARTGEQHLVESFNYAAEWANKYVLPEGEEMDYSVELAPTVNKYEATKIACYMVGKGMAAMFSGGDAGMVSHLSSVFDQLHVPYFSLVNRLGRMHNSNDSSTTLHMFPDDAVMQSIRDLVLYWGWKRLLIVYRDDQRVARLSRFLEDGIFAKLTVSMIKLDSDDYLGAAKKLKTAEKCNPDRVGQECLTSVFNRVLLDLAPEDTHRFLTSALQIGLIELKHWYILTTTDLAYFDMSLFRHNHARFVAPSLIDQDSEYSVRKKFLAHIRQKWNDSNINLPYFPATDAALLFDSVVTFARTYVDLLPNWIKTATAKCDSSEHDIQPHPLGRRIYNSAMEMMESGLTGSIQLSKGERRNVSLGIQMVGYNGVLDQIGNWHSHSDLGVNLNEVAADQLRKHLVVSQELKPHLRVTTIEERPYVMLRRNHYEFKGNEKFEGFCIDLLENLANDLGFSYTINLVKDKKYGNEDDNKTTWNGMIGEILRNEADMAVAPLTVNFKRAEHVAFTKPFLSLGISILFRIPSDQQPALFSFLNPLSLEIWFWIVVAGCFITIGMYFIARLTPYEWNPTFACCSAHQPQPACDLVVHDSGIGDGSVELANNYSFFNTLWYVTSTLLKGGCDFGPRAVSTRLLGGTWWVFTLVITSAYTANLAAVLTVDRHYIPIKNLEDLANQSGISYGAIMGGSTMQFFMESKIKTHTKMWSYMSNAQPSVFVSSNREGVRKVLEENYAYLMESTSLEYEVQQNCNLTQVGGVLGSKGYGIALSKGSEWTDRISRQILDYAEKGVIELAKTKWWRVRGTACSKTSSAVVEQRLSLNMTNVAGLFVILAAGLMAAVVSVVFEFWIKSRENAKIDKKSVVSEMANELQFALMLHDPSTHPSRSKPNDLPPSASTRKAATTDSVKRNGGQVLVRRQSYS